MLDIRKDLHILALNHSSAGGNVALHWVSLIASAKKGRQEGIESSSFCLSDPSFVYNLC